MCDGEADYQKLLHLLKSLFVGVLPLPEMPTMLA